MKPWPLYTYYCSKKDGARVYDGPLMRLSLWSVVVGVWFSNELTSGALIASIFVMLAPMFF